MTAKAGANSSCCPSPSESPNQSRREEATRGCYARRGFESSEWAPPSACVVGVAARRTNPPLLVDVPTRSEFALVRCAENDRGFSKAIWSTENDTEEREPPAADSSERTKSGVRLSGVWSRGVWSVGVGSLWTCVRPVAEREVDAARDGQVILRPVLLALDRLPAVANPEQLEGWRRRICTQNQRVSSRSFVQRSSHLFVDWYRLV